MYELCFWMLTGVGIGFLIAYTWELMLGILLVVTLIMTMLLPGGPVPSGESGEWPFSGAQTLRWFIRTSLAILAALITSMLVPFQEHLGNLMEHPQHATIIAASVVTALLSVVLTRRIDPVNDLLLKLFPENEAMKDGLAAK